MVQQNVLEFKQPRLGFLLLGDGLSWLLQREERGLHQPPLPLREMR